jgi:rhodanese-related sulfurtransferase
MIRLFLIALLSAFTAMSSCAQDDHKKFKNDSEVPRITVEDAKKLFDEGALFIDARSPDQYKIEHIKGAINVVHGAPDSEIEKVPKGKKIIVYCS